MTMGIMNMTNPLLPSKSEIWMVDFNPSTGAEINKTRPAVVISEDSIGKLPLRILVPITDWKPSYHTYPWFVHFTPSPVNGLTKESGADAFQIKSLSVNRFRYRIGKLTATEQKLIIDSVLLCIGV